MIDLNRQDYDKKKIVIPAIRRGGFGWNLFKSGRFPLETYGNDTRKLEIINT